MRRFLALITRNPLSLVGTAVATAAAITFLSLFGIELVGVHAGPYTGILTYMVIPSIFVFGLLLVPLGFVWERRRMRAREARGEDVSRFPVIDLNAATTRHVVLIVIGLTVVNVALLATATYKGVEVMDSSAFCGSTCHTVMQPEFTAYQGSPHSRVQCVECHIGPGADWFVQSKLSGSWQVISVAFDLYPRPIPTPIENLRPARETCEQCHWPTKFVGDKLRTFTHFKDDETNTAETSVVLLRVGGISGRKSQGIHWHVDPKVQVRYRSDRERKKIYDVELTAADGTKQLFKPKEPAPEGEVGEWRTMDCVDCHNRPTHVFSMPADAIDKAMLDGRIDRGLPFIKREGKRVLKEEYASHEEASAKIPAALKDFYRQDYPDLSPELAGRVDEAGESLVKIYTSNVFPEMKVTWGTYKNHIGHKTSKGCFRCHDDEHATEDGKFISQDCEHCHSLLAEEEEDPEILRTLNP